MTELLVHLGIDPAAVSAWLKSSIRSVVLLSKDPAIGSNPLSLRLALDDGRTVKLRRCRSVARARLYRSIVTQLDDARLSRVFSRLGTLTLEEWIEGQPIRCDFQTAKEIDAAADLLASLHQRRRIGAHALPERIDGRRLGAAVEKDLQILEGRGAIEPGLARQIRGAIERGLPTSARVAVVHTDLCPENLLNTSGVLRAVDNESIRVGPIGYDLARVWYRWPMPEAHWSALIARYARSIDPTEDLRCAEFWRTAAVLRSARVHLVRQVSGLDQVFERLRSLL